MKEYIQEMRGNKNINTYIEDQKQEKKGRN